MPETRKKIKKPRLPVEALSRLKRTHTHNSKKVYTRREERKKLKEIIKDFDMDAGDLTSS